jgi:hypothetical protein
MRLRHQHPFRAVVLYYNGQQWTKEERINDEIKIGTVDDVLDDSAEVHIYFTNEQHEGRI